jgi:hypothetical protein
VTWTRTEPVYECNPAQEVSTDIITLKTWVERRTDIAKIRTLAVNWDGDDSVPPTYGVWSRAQIFLNILHERKPGNPPKKIAVSPDGLIALEWFDSNAFVRAEIGDTEQVEWMFATPGFPAEFRTETVAELKTPPEQGHVWEPAMVDEPACASEL